MSRKRRLIHDLRWNRIFLVIICMIGLAVLFRTITAPSVLALESEFFADKRISEIDWHPDSQRIAIAGVTAKVYSIHNFQSKYIHDTHGETSIEWSTDGSKLAISGAKVWLWDGTDSIQLTDESRYRFFSDVTWNMNDDVIIASSFGLTNEDNFLWIWDVRSFELVGKLQGDNSLESTNLVGDMGFLSLEPISNSNLIITSSWENNHERFWDTENMHAMSLVSVDVAPSATLKASPSGEFVAIANNAEPSISVVPLDKSADILILESELNTIDLLEWNADSNFLLGGNFDTDEIVIWEIEQRGATLSQKLLSTNQIDVDWHPENNLVAIATDNEVTLWNVDSNEGHIVHLGYSYIVEWSPDGEKLAVVTREGLHVYMNFDQIASIEF